jgi:hypothetical protein
MSRWDSSPSPEMGVRMLLILLIGALVYVTVAEGRYRFRHPEMTETQLFLHTGDILLWQD